MFKGNSSIGGVTRTARRAFIAGLPMVALGVLVSLLIVACASTSRPSLARASVPGLYISTVHADHSATTYTYNVTSFAPATGKAAWHVSAPFSSFTNTAVPVVAGPLLLAPILVAPSSTAGENASPTGRLIAYDRVSGQQFWQITTPIITSAPIVVNSTVYFTALTQRASNANQKVVYAVRADDGAPLWHVTIPQVDGFSDTLASVNGTLYITSNQICFDSCSAAYLFAVRSSDGKLLWTQTFTGNFNIHPATIAQGMLYLQVPRVDPAFGSANEIDALRASDGAIVWRYATQQSQSEASGMLVVANEMVYTGSTFAPDNNPYHSDHWVYSLVALDGQTGALRWRAATNIFPQALAANGQTVIVADLTEQLPVGHITGYFLSAFGVSDGARIWRHGTTVQTDAAQLVGASLVCLLTSFDPATPNFAVAYNASDGDERWRTMLAGNTYPTEPSGAFVIAGGTLYAAFNSTTLSALDLTNGHLLWRTTLGDPIVMVTAV